MGNELIGQEIPVLDHGYIKLIDVMGSDRDIAQGARVSYSGKDNKTVRDDEGLIDYLMRHKHTSPFELAVLKFEIKLPIFVERQWVRHRTCSMNEISGRYAKLPDEYYIPEERIIGEQSKSNKQGREVGDHPYSFTYRSGLMDQSRRAFERYEASLDAGIPKELARVGLPLGTYTKKIWQMNLHNLFHFLNLRTDSHAQWEIRQYAKVIEEIVSKLFPVSYKSWRNHVKLAINLSYEEQRMLLKHIGLSNIENAYDNLADEDVLSKSKRQELKDKLFQILNAF